MSNSPFQNRFYRSLLLIVAFLFLVVLPIGLSNELSRLSDGLASRSWPSVPGKITGSRVEQVRGSRSRESAYFPRIEFDYRVDGLPFHGDRLSAHSSAQKTFAQAKVVADRYPIGGAARVYYDPARPQSSLLMPGTSHRPATPFFMIAIFFAAGLTLLGLWYQTLPARQWRMVPSSNSIA